MDASQGPEHQDQPDGRHETEIQRLDRQWSDLLQQLRVIQTGVQFLTGFLLTLPFQARFADLGTLERRVYLGTVSSAILATILLQAPVAVARGLFRRHERGETVQVAHRLSEAGMFFLGLAICGVALVVFAQLSNTTIGAAAGAVTAVLLIGFWLVLPRALRTPGRRR